jgi:hypothetical protein
VAAEAADDGEGTSEEEAVSAPLLSWPSEEPPRNTPERRLWRDYLELQESLRGDYLLPDPPFRQQVVVAPGTLDLFPTALRLRHFSQPLTPRQRRLLRCHNPLFSRRCLRFSPPSHGDRNLMNPWRVAERVLEKTWDIWASSCCWRRLKEAGEGPERVKLRRAALRQEYCFWSHRYGRRSLEERLRGRFTYRPPPEPRRVPRGPRGRQRREQATKRKLLLAHRLAAARRRRRQLLLAHRLATARLRLLLRRLVFHLASLRSLEQIVRSYDSLQHHLVQWLQRLEAYDASADPLRTYLRSRQKPIWWQRVLLLRKAGWELRQLGQLLPPLRRSLVAPGAHSEGFRLLADTLDVFDKDQLRWLVEEEARRLAEEIESAEEVAPKSPEKGAGEAEESVVGHHPLVRYSRAFLKELRRRLQRK